MIHVLFYEKTTKTHPKPKVLFNNVYKSEWLEDPMVRRIITDVDLSDECRQYTLGSLDVLTMEDLSEAAKVLILLYKYTDGYFEPSLREDNIASYRALIEVGKRRDVFCVIEDDRYNMQGVDDFDFYCVNDGFYCYGRKEWLNKMIIYHTYEEREVSSKTVRELSKFRG